MALLLTIEVRINFSIGFDNTEERTSQKIKMVTNKHVTEVVRNRCVNHQAKILDSTTIFHLIETFVGALLIWINKQTKKNIVDQTNKLNK